MGGARFTNDFDVDQIPSTLATLLLCDGPCFFKVYLQAEPVDFKQADKSRRTIHTNNGTGHSEYLTVILYHV